MRLIEELRASRQRLVAAQDAERRKLERDLHDGAQQQFVAVGIKARLADTLIDRDEERAHAMLREVVADTQAALEDLRIWRMDLPTRAGGSGSRRGPGRAGPESPAPGRDRRRRLAAVPVGDEAAIYFCCLEAIQNIAKYAEAARATIRVWRDDDQLGFSVIDDGRGFDPDVTSRGAGLQNMADRLAALGGSLVVRSEPGVGTTIEGRAPVPA